MTTESWPKELWMDEFGGQSAEYDKHLNGVKYTRSDISREEVHAAYNNGYLAALEDMSLKIEELK